MRTKFAAAALALVFVAACGSTEQWQENQKGLAFASQQMAASGNLQPVANRMQSLLNDTQKGASDFQLQRFFAAFVLAQIHASASLGDEYLTEVSTAGTRVRGIGRAGGQGGGTNQSPSTNRHILAAVYNASLARAWYGGAARSGPKYEDVTLLPPDLAGLGVDNADANLGVILATSLSRLNFDERVGKILDESPAALFELESCMEALDSFEVQDRLRPWVALMIFQHLSEDDPEEAYRFGVSAVEGKKRFGQTLPADETAAIERWITSDAKVQFVCPNDKTAYLSGVDQCPVDATPHLDYIAVDKLP